MLIVANWKMNGSKALLKDCLDYWQSTPTDRTVVVCPPFPFLDYALENMSFIRLGAQTCHQAEQGAHTGHVSAVHLKEMACAYTLVGHSECRQYNGETNEQVRTKATLLQHQGIIPIICVGETLKQYEQGASQQVVADQLRACIPLESEHFFIAYEPIWAIGTGKTATETDIENMHSFINKTFKSQGVLYGGSVTAANASTILKVPHVHGLLVGGASLKKDDFFNIIHA